MQAVFPIIIDTVRIVHLEPHSNEPPYLLNEPRYLLCTDCLLLIHGLEDIRLLIASLTPRVEDIWRTQDQSLLSTVVRDLLERPAYLIFIQRFFATAHVCCRLAALVFVDMCLQGRDAPSETDFTQKNRHRNLIAMLYPYVSWYRTITILLRLLLGGDHRLALEDPRRAWFIVDAIMLVLTVSEDTWEVVERVLRSYLLDPDAEGGVPEPVMFGKWEWDLKGLAREVVDEWEVRG